MSEIVEIRAGLEALIDKVTPSPWDIIDRDDEPLQLVHYDGDADDNGREVIHRDEICSIADNETEQAHLAYLRLCEPANIRLLLEALTAVEAERDEARATNKELHRRTQEAEAFLVSTDAIVKAWAKFFEQRPESAFRITEEQIERVRDRVKSKREEWAAQHSAWLTKHAEPLWLTQAKERAESAEARATAAETRNAELVEGLKLCADRLESASGALVLFHDMNGSQDINEAATAADKEAVERARSLIGDKSNG